MATNRLDFLKRVAAGEQAVESEQEAQIDSSRLEILKEIAGPPGVAGFQDVPEPDVGIGTSFGVGVKEGLLMPLTIFGREGQEVEKDEVSEKVAGFLGEMVGLGIGFVPFSVGTGVVLKGVGLAGKMSPATLRATQNILGGTFQAAGIAEEPEDVPKTAAIGAAVGGAVELFFLSRAMRGRAAEAGRVPKTPETGAPIADELVPAETLNKEYALLPKETDSATQVQAKVNLLADENLSYDDVLADLTEEFQETVILPNVRDVEGELAKIAERHPRAQVVLRQTKGGASEILVHNPAFDDARLTAKQIQQWKSQGVFEDMGVLYRGELYRATGNPVAPGHIQVRDLSRPITFAARESEVVIPTNPHVLSEASARQSRALEVLSSQRQIGFTLEAGGQGGIRRGVVDTSDFEVVESLEDFIKENLEVLGQIEARTPDEALGILGRRMGIRGIIEREAGVTKNVRVLDQDAVSFVREPPRPSSRVGLDRVRLNEDGTVHSFEPTWKNAIIAPLRKAGYPEKELNVFLEQYATNVNQRMVGIMDDEIQALHRANQFRWFGGCL